MEWLGAEKPGEGYVSRNRLSGSARLSFAALALDQQRASGTRSDRAAASVPYAELRSRHRAAPQQRVERGHPEHHITGQYDQSAGGHRTKLVRRGLRESAPPLFARAKSPGELHLLQEPDQRAGFSFADGRSGDP